MPREHARTAVWVEPVLVAEVEYTEWTRDGRLRHPSYKGLRDDVPPEEVARDESSGTKVAVDVEGRQVVLSNLDKVLYPAAGFTKGQVLDYYTRIAPVLLPHLAGRALTRKRYPDGVEGQVFFEKNAPRGTPEWVRTVDAADARVEQGPRDDRLRRRRRPRDPGLDGQPRQPRAAHAHVAGRPRRPRPGRVRPRPGPAGDRRRVLPGGLLLRPLLEADGLVPLAKTSGSKGLQLYARADGLASSEQTSAYAKGLAQRLEQEQPDLVVHRMTKALRDGKVLVDWSQNSAAKTTVSVYWLRARERPTVSTPVTWDEVEACASPAGPRVHQRRRAGPGRALGRPVRAAARLSAASTERRRRPGAGGRPGAGCGSACCPGTAADHPPPDPTPRRTTT